MSTSRMLRLVTVSSPVFLVSISLALPLRSWYEDASGSLESALNVCRPTANIMTPETDVFVPTGKSPRMEGRREALCPTPPWLLVEVDSTTKSLDPSNAVVLSGASALSLLDQQVRPAPCHVLGTWTPTDSQVKQLEFDLAHFFANRKRRAQSIDLSVPQLEPYQRRYGGLILAGGERVIFVNAFSWPYSTPAPIWEWRVEEKPLFGLRTSYYVVEYNADRRSFRGFAHKEWNEPMPGFFWARPLIRESRQTRTRFKGAV